MFSVTLLDAILTAPFLSMSALILIEVIISVIVYLPMANSKYR